jgi:ABC-type uncharacterized transport system substrate-binding protein
MRKSVAIAASLAAIAAFAPRAAQAHPHVWVTVETEVLYGPNQDITGFRHTWIFDEMYTAFAVQGLDKDGDGKYSREELQPLAEVNVTALKEFGLYTYPKLNDKVLERKDAVDYWLEYADSTLALHLTIPLKDPISAGDAKNFSFGVYDPTLYVDFSYAKETPIRLGAGAPAGCAPKVTAPKPLAAREVPLSEAFYQGLDAQSNFGAQYASVVTIECGQS